MTIQSLLLGTFSDSQSLFEPMASRDRAIWLDSGTRKSAYSRFDILACEPAVSLVTRGAITQISGDTEARESADDPLSLLRHELHRRCPAPATQDSLPTSGGALGYFSYELGHRFESLPTPPPGSGDFPEMAVGLYDWVVVYNRESREALLTFDDSLVSDQIIEYWYEKLSALPPTPAPMAPFEILQEPLPEVSFDDYAMAFDKVKHYLREGDCYQVNLAQRFRAQARGNPWSLYKRLREINPAPFSAYLNFPWAQLLCASPERFLSVRDREVETRPIKGTRPRSNNTEQDAQNAEALRNSAKDRAENVMIVDLLRNDLGRSCKPGSIKVPNLFEVESFATVHHLVSTVTGQLTADRDALDLFRGSFPGGSITGAPKVRAMEIIQELEPARRDIYCGSIGYIGYDGNMDTNIVIRTLLHQHGKLTYWAGGGLVMDSTLEDEYQETLDKAYALQRVLQKALWESPQDTGV